VKIAGRYLILILPGMRAWVINKKIRRQQMITADIKGGVELKGNRLTLIKEFITIYYALEKADPALLDTAIDIIEKQAADGLEADDFIKKVVDLHGLE
jgi:hypothetical protein